MNRNRPPLGLVLAGGVAMGAFEAGACARLEASGEAPPDWIVGASVGALNAAIWAAAAQGQGSAALRAFWGSAAQEPPPLTTFLLGPPPRDGALRGAHNRAAALRAVLLGRPGLFQAALRLGEGSALYDLAPLRARLLRTLDFDRLNHGPVRLSIVTTDAQNGARVVFDTGRGACLTVDHLLAAAALPPLFAPVEVEGRRLVDGGLSGHAPLDILLAEVGSEGLACLVVESFRRDATGPRRRMAAAPRVGEAGFGRQTRLVLAACAREWEVRARMGCLARHVPEERRSTPEVAGLLRAAGVGGTATVVLMGYPAGAGPGEAFDFSAATLADRWAAGEAAMGKGLRRLVTPDHGTELAPGLRLHEVTGTPRPT